MAAITASSVLKAYKAPTPPFMDIKTPEPLEKVLENVLLLISPAPADEENPSGFSDEDELEAGDRG